MGGIMDHSTSVTDESGPSAADESFGVRRGCEYRSGYAEPRQLRPAVEQRELHLRGGERNAGLDQPFGLVKPKIGQPDLAYQPLLAQRQQRLRHLDVTVDGQIPPCERRREVCEAAAQGSLPPASSRNGGLERRRSTEESQQIEFGDGQG